MSSQIHLKILPSVRCLFDKLVQVKIEGLLPHRNVELRSQLVDDRGVVFKASAHYRADQSGQVDVSRSPSLGGSYTGVEPMGWLWSMTPETPHSKLLKKNVLTPTLVELEALSAETGEVLARETNTRGYMTEGMTRVPVKEGRIRGVLFIPPGDRKFPGVVDMDTFGSGVSESRASLLANNGFVVLALAGFAYRDLPQMPKCLHLEYFEEGVEYLRSRPEVTGSGVGLLSISHSGFLAMLMSALLPGISATVCVNSHIGNTGIPVRYKDMMFPPLRLILRNLKFSDSGVIILRDIFPDPTSVENRASLVPIEQATCPLLLAASLDDCNWDSASYARQVEDIFRSHGKNSLEVVLYPNAGHFLEVPHLPFCPSAVHKGIGAPTVFGGQAKGNSDAQLDLWERIQEFFNKHLEN